MVEVQFFIKGTPWTQDVNWTYIRRSEDVQDVFWTSYVLSIYVLRPGDTNKWFKNFQALKKAEGYLRRYRPIEVFDLESFIQYVRKTFKNY